MKIVRKNICIGEMQTETSEKILHISALESKRISKYILRYQANNITSSHKCQYKVSLSK